MELVNRTIQECFLERIKKTPHTLAYQFNDVGYTWKETANAVFAVAKELKEKGIQPGDKVGLLTVNSESWIFYFFALQLLGAKTVLLNASLNSDEIIRNIELTEVKYLCYGEGYHRNYDELIDRIRLTCMRSSYYGSISIYRDAKEWKEIAKNETDFEAVKALPDDICCFLFTSGTTMNAKAVMLTHHNLVNNALAIAEAMRWSEEDRMCVAVPFFHCFGLTACILTGIQKNFSLFVLAHFRTQSVCEEISKHKCTILNGVPSMFLAMCHNPNIKQYNLSSVRSGIVAGSPIFEKDYIEICQMFDKEMRLQPSYGQTESSPCITIANFTDSLETKSVTVGKAIEHVEIRIVHDEDGNLCKIAQTGMVQTRGYHVMKGYYAMQEETAQAITEDGWLITGDIGYLDENGYLHISGRKKNLIIRGGENISPEEIEYYIRQVEGVDLVKVMGIPAVVLQEEIVACIINHKKNLTKEDIIRKLKQHLADYKIPRYIFFLNEIEKSASGKIDEKKLMKTVLRIIKEES